MALTFLRIISPGTKSGQVSKGMLWVIGGINQPKDRWCFPFLFKLWVRAESECTFFSGGTTEELPVAIQQRFHRRSPPCRHEKWDPLRRAKSSLQPNQRQRSSLA